jgi:hypothetical protein
MLDTNEWVRRPSGSGMAGAFASSSREHPREFSMKPLLDIIEASTPQTPRRRSFCRTFKTLCVSVVALPLALCGVSIEFDSDERDAGERWLDLVCRQQTHGNQDG